MTNTESFEGTCPTCGQRYHGMEPPPHGVPAKDRFKPAVELAYGETPFDTLTRGELLRLVQAYHLAAGAAGSVLQQARAREPASLYWSTIGSGGKALFFIDTLIDLCGDRGMNETSERIWRSFFRHAVGLLFPTSPDPHDHWTYADPPGSDGMPENARTTAPMGTGRRPMTWADLMPIPGEGPIEI